MAQFKLKSDTVEARRIDHNLVLIHDKKGELRAKPGDWLIGSERGKIDVVKDDDFREQYEDVEESEHEPAGPLVYEPLTIGQEVTVDRRNKGHVSSFDPPQDVPEGSIQVTFAEDDVLWVSRGEIHEADSHEAVIPVEPGEHKE